ncbi:hypothetical protein KUTeg_021550 [Tegillarca granosa]|uniref:Uncharacterized protein n=1 Tax=Tegillarca granosa TaxID=220873 RepID=A0ABQ9E6H8_TEGGR|nr:hypothetical protein KUTeg_021550 [Tegillarca granosa]
MESLIVPSFNQTECLNLDKRMCYSPTANFGDDFNVIIREMLKKQSVHENSMVEESIECKVTDHGETNDSCKQKHNTMTTNNKIGTENEIADKALIRVKSDGDRKGEDTESNKDQKNKNKEKKKKWKPMPMENLGFNLSLFPRPVNDNLKTSENDRRLFEKIEEEYEKFEAKCEPFENLRDFEGCVFGKEKYLRADKDRKVRKVHKEIKDKYCRNIKNNKGRKTLYIHHRLSKLISLDIQSMSYLPCATKEKSLELAKNNSAKKTVYTRSPVTAARPANPQCLAYAIDNNNLPSDIDSQIANLLINIQHRDLTPEDYDLLLRLDDRVKPKTLDETTLTKFKTDKVENNDNCEIIFLKKRLLLTIVVYNSCSIWCYLMESHLLLFQYETDEGWVGEGSAAKPTATQRSLFWVILITSSTRSTMSDLPAKSAVTGIALTSATSAPTTAATFLSSTELIMTDSSS